MKKALFIVSALLTAFLVAFPAAAGSVFDAAALKAEASKAVPGNAQLLSAEGNEDGAFATFQQGGRNYQFTLAADTDPQIPDSSPLTYKGRTAYFFEPGLPSAGGLMIILGEEKSLTILYMPGFDADDDATAKDLTAIADKMNLDRL